MGEYNNEIFDIIDELFDRLKDCVKLLGEMLLKLLSLSDMLILIPYFLVILTIIKIFNTF